MSPSSTSSSSESSINDDYEPWDEADDYPEEILNGFTGEGVFDNPNCHLIEPDRLPVEYLDNIREDEKYHEQAKLYAQKALETFKDDSGLEYELVNLLLFDGSCNFLDYYVSFSAKQKDALKDDVIKTFRAMVTDTHSDIIVVECVIKTPYRTLQPSQIPS